MKGGRKCSGVAAAIFMNTDSTTLATTSTFAPRTALKSLKEDSKKPQELLSNVDVASPSKTPKKGKEGRSFPSRKLSNSQDSNAKLSTFPLSHAELFSMPTPMKDSHVLSHQFLAHFITCKLHFRISQ